MGKWNYICEICKNNIVEDHDIEVVKEHIGATHDCPKCDGLLIINENLTVSDFGNILVERYRQLGLDVTKEEATGTYM